MEGKTYFLPAIFGTKFETFWEPKCPLGFTIVLIYMLSAINSTEIDVLYAMQQNWIFPTKKRESAVYLV